MPGKKLKEITDRFGLQAEARGRELNFDQCTVDAETPKPTIIVVHHWGVHHPALDGVTPVKPVEFESVTPQTAPVRRTPLRGAPGRVGEAPGRFRGASGGSERWEGRQGI